VRYALWRPGTPELRHMLDRAQNATNGCVCEVRVHYNTVLFNLAACLLPRWLFRQVNRATATRAVLARARARGRAVGLAGARRRARRMASVRSTRRLAHLSAAISAVPTVFPGPDHTAPRFRAGTANGLGVTVEQDPVVRLAVVFIHNHVPLK